MCSSVSLSSDCLNLDLFQSVFNSLFSQLGFTPVTITSSGVSPSCVFTFCVDTGFDWSTYFPDFFDLQVKLAFSFLLFLLLHFCYKFMPGD